MQNLARQGYSADQVRGFIQRRVRSVDWGVDLLDTSDTFVRALRVSECTVSRTMYADVHGAVDLTTTEDLDWPTARVRPWQSIEGVRFDLGVFGLERPVKTSDGKNKVHGRDKLQYLQRIIGDTYWRDTGVGYLDAMRQAIADSGVTGAAPLIDSAAEATTLPAPMVWALDLQAPASYLRVCNDLGAAITYRGLWVDEDGHYRAIPYVAPTLRPSDWTLDLTDARTNIVTPDRSITTETGGTTTAWRFLRNGMTTRPVEGAGVYTVGPWSDPSANRALYAFDASDQASLVSQGNRQIATDTGRSQVMQLATGALPCLGHFDIFDVHDPAMGPDAKAQCRAWTQPLHKGNVGLTLEVIA